ncbi:hypothetical protein PENTCL1PPCAC_27204, partial [Pristionchus entomophagus]
VAFFAVMGAQNVEEEEIRNEPFYHGKITRVRAEAIVKENGDFLVRDSISNAGEFVLTSYWKKPLHFQINAERDRMGNRVYMFEEEEFSTVSSLVNFYRTHRRPITLSTGCLISQGIEKGGGEEILNAKGVGAELEAQYAKIFRPTAIGGKPSYVASPGLSKTAMVNWASRSSLASASSVSNLSRPAALPPVPASLLRSGLPMPKRSPPQMRKSREEEDYCEMDYDAMEPDPLHSPLIGGTRSVFNMNVPNHMRESILRPSQSLEKLTFDRHFDTLPSRGYAPRSPSSVHSEILLPSLHSPTADREPGNRKSDISADSGQRSADSSSRPASTIDGTSIEEEDDYDLPKADQLFARADSRLSKSSVPTTNTSSEGHGSTASTSREESDYDEPKDRRDLRSAIVREKPAIPNKPVLMAKPPIGGKPAIPPKPSPIDAEPIPPQLHRLRHFVMEHSERELAEIMGREDCGLLGLIGSEIEPRLAGAGALLLPSGHERRARMKARCRNTQLAVVFSIVSSESQLEAARVLALWIRVAAHAIKRNGNQFTFVNIMRALTSEKLNISSLWERVDVLARQDFRLLAKSFKTITSRGEHPLDSVACSIPFLHPLLDIFDAGNDVESSYLDRSSPAKELDSTFFWLDMARDWCSASCQFSQRSSSHFSAPTRLTKTNLLTDSALSALLPLGEQLQSLFLHLPRWR